MALLNFCYFGGSPKAPTSWEKPGRCSLAQRSVIEALHAQAMYVVLAEDVLPCLNWEAQVASAKLTYSGEAVQKAVDLNWEAVEAALPPSDLSGRLVAAELTSPVV